MQGRLSRCTTKGKNISILKVHNQKPKKIRKNFNLSFFEFYKIDWIVFYFFLSNHVDQR